MALPHVFANVSVLQTPHLDDNFNAIGALVIIPCTATGTNTIALTPAANTPTVSAYSNLTPVFAFLAAATSNGAVTINVNGIGAKNLYKNNGAIAAGSGDLVSGSLYLVSYNSALNAAVGGFVLNNQSANQAPTVQRLTVGSGTYTPTAGTVRVRVTQIGPGGGGAAVATNAGANGNPSTFQVNGAGTAWSCGGGVGGATAGGAGGAGGTTGVDGSTGLKVFRYDGSAGQAGGQSATAGVNIPSGAGGASMFGGAGASVTGTTAGNAAKANTGSGGSGGHTAAGNSGGGGGSGEIVVFWVTGITSAAYTVGAKGAGGAAGTQAGGDGSDGITLVEEFYW